MPELHLHSAHPYPCKFTPELVRRYLPKEGIILDPYCGSGTTLLEAATRGHDVVGIDCNPIALLISRCKLAIFDEQLHSDMMAMANSSSAIQKAVTTDVLVEDFAGRNHWFSEQSLREISFIQILMSRYERESNSWIVLATSLSAILNTFSNQDSETRYSRREKEHKPGELFVAFTKKVLRILAGISERGPLRSKSDLYLIDLTDDSTLPSLQADFVITSPPYANTMDYYLYHKQRMNILGYDFKTVKDMEIGSRNQFSSKKEDSSVWSMDYQEAMLNVSRMVRPGGAAWFVIGDSQIAGERIDGGQMTLDCASNLGYEAEIIVSEAMSGRSRMFNSSFQSPNKFEHVVRVWF